MSHFDEITDEEFDGILENIVDGMLASSILTIPGVYEIVKEELNNDVLSTWANANNRCEICGKKLNEDKVCDDCD